MGPDPVVVTDLGVTEDDGIRTDNVSLPKGDSGVNDSGGVDAVHIGSLNGAVNKPRLYQPR